MKIHQSDDKIIVTELMPMSLCPRFSEVLLERIGHANLEVGMLISESDRKIYAGWIPMPQYRPEATPIDPEGFRKGVKVLFDYLHDRIANNYHANLDQMAELQKINKVVEEWLSDALREVSEDDYQEWLELHQAYVAGAEKYKRSHELYEKLRKLTPHQFAGLAEINLHREGSFDELVAKLP